MKKYVNRRPLHATMCVCAAPPDRTPGDSYRCRHGRVWQPVQRRNERRWIEVKSKKKKGTRLR